METLSRFALGDVDGLSWLEGLPAGSVDALVVALPDARKLELERYGQLAFAIGRVLARGRRGFWICESKHGLGIARLAERYGLELQEPIIWDRGATAKGGRLRWILPLSRGRARGLPGLPSYLHATGAGLPDVLAEELVMLATVAGQWIFEPFAATPGLAAAAIRLGRPWAGANPHLADREALKNQLYALGARPTELPVRWDPEPVRVRSGSPLALSLGEPTSLSVPRVEREAEDTAVAGE